MTRTILGGRRLTILTESTIIALSLSLSPVGQVGYQSLCLSWNDFIATPRLLSFFHGLPKSSDQNPSVPLQNVHMSRGLVQEQKERDRGRNVDSPSSDAQAKVEVLVERCAELVLGVEPGVVDERPVGERDGEFAAVEESFLLEVEVERLSDAGLW